MKLINLVIWLLISLTYGLAPLWAVGFGLGSIIFLVIQIVVPSTPIFFPVLFYILFFVSSSVSYAQYGQRREDTTDAPPPMKEA